MCGGKSTRMKSDKGLLKFHSQYWVEIAYQKLYSLDIPVSVSINTTQLENYQKFFPNYDFIIDNNQLLINGPLLGIVSAHLQYPKDDLLIFATDMLATQTNTLNHLLELNAPNLYEINIYQTLDYLQPLCAIYTKNALDKIAQSIQSNQLENYSLKNIIQSLHTQYIQPKEDGEFQNFNTPEELQTYINRSQI